MADIDNLFIKSTPKEEVEETKEDIRHTFEKIDYYAILGIKKEASHREIKLTYQKKLKMFHPDKIEQTKDNKLKYKMIREAGDILTNVYKRKAYDLQYKTDTFAEDFISNKEAYKEFIRLQKQHMSEEDKKIAKLNFDRSLQEIIKEHKLNDMKPLTQDEHTRKIEDLILQREQESFDIHHNNVFDGQQFNSDVFNSIFEKHKTFTPNENNTGMVLFKDGIGVYNNDNHGTSLDNYDSLYAKGNYNDYNENYSGFDNELIDQINDDISIDSPDETDVLEGEHLDTKVSNNTLDTDIKNLLSERESQDNKFNNMSHNEFGSAMDDDYGISKQFGFMIGNDRYGHQKTTNSKLTKSNVKIYKELTQS